jgi:hypothetical protein
LWAASFHPANTMTCGNVFDSTVDCKTNAFRGLFKCVAINNILTISWQNQCSCKEAGMTVWTEKEQQEALAAVGTLKRALGIPNHKSKKDEFVDGRLQIYTPDFESAELIGELLFRYGNGRRAKFYDSRPDHKTLRDTIRVEPLSEGGYDASMCVVHSSHFSKMILKMVNKHLSPDKVLTR